MKKVVTGIFTFLIGAYLLAWFIAANHVKNKVESVLNSTQTIPGVVVNYDKVSLNGFPFKLGATIKGLSISGKTGNLLQLASNDLKQQFTPEQLNLFYSLENKLSFNQDLEYSINPFTSTISFTTNNIEFDTKDANNDVNIRTSGRTNYGFTFDKFNLAALFSKGKKSLINITDINSIRIKSGPTSIVELNSKETLMSVKSTSLNWQRKPAANSQLQNYRLQYQVNDSYTSKDFFKPMQKIAFFKVLFDQLGSNLMIPHGKGEINIDMIATLPNVPLFDNIDPANLYKDKNPEKIFNKKFVQALDKQPIQFVVNKFLINNSRGLTDFNAKFVQKPLANNHFQFDTSVHAKMTNTKEFVEVIKQKYLTQLKPALERKGLHITNPQQYQTAAYNLVPQLDQWGEITFDTENSMVWSADKNKDFHLVLKQFALNTQPFKITLTGDVQNDGQQQKQLVLQLSLYNYQDIISRALYTVEQFVALMNSTNASQTSHILVNENGEQKIISLLQKIAGNTDPSVHDTTIDIKLEKDGSFKIGTMPITELVQKIQTLSLVKEIPVTKEQPLAHIKQNTKSGDVDA